MSTNKICKIGLLGAARITPPALIVPAGENASAHVTAIAARETSRAQAFAKEHKIPQVFDNYQALIDDPDIDLVYNALPASLHHPWTLKALDAGKHVLCEKPVALDSVQARAMVEHAKSRGRLMIEAFHYRYHPLIQKVIELLESGAIGKVKDLEGIFNVSIQDTSDIRYQKALGGGALMDLGCYPVHWLRTCMGEEPEVVSASARTTDSGVDVSLQGEFCFAEGVTGRVACSMAPDQKMVNSLKIEGTEGSMDVINPLVPQHGYKLTVQNKSGIEDIRVEGRSTYQHQLDAVIDLLQGKGTQITGGEDCINNMSAIESLYRAAGVPGFSD